MSEKLDTAEEIVVQKSDESKKDTSLNEKNFCVSDQEKIENTTKNEESTEDASKQLSSAEKKELSDAEIQQQKLNEAEQSVSKNKSKKGKHTNLIFFIVNLVVVGAIIAYQLTHEEFTSLTGLSFRFEYLLVIVALIMGVICSDSIGVSYLLKQSTGKWQPALSYKVAQLGKYYDDITPLAAGGQPFQATYLKGRGVPLQNSLSIPLAKYVFGQVAWLIISLTALIVSSIDKSYGDWVTIMSVIGFVLTFSLLFVVLFLSISKKAGRFLIAKTLKLLQKMKIVKNYEKQYEKITKLVSDYQEVMKQYAKSPKDFLVLVVSSIIKTWLHYSIPYFIVMFFVPVSLGADIYFKMIIMSVLVDLAASFFPLPGGAGMSEISFSAAFASIIAPLNLSVNPGVWVMIMWRFCSFYFYLLQGIGIMTYDTFYGNKKYRWQVVKNNLAEESAVFKQEQINRFRADRAKRRKAKNKV